MVDFNNIDDLSDKELKWGYWWAVHKHQVKAAGLLLVMVGLAGLYIFNGVKLFNYFATAKQHSQMLSDLTTPLIDYAKIRRKQAPRALLVKEPIVIPREGKVDIIALAENLNSRWWLEEIVYQFAVAGELTPETSTFFMPREKKYVYALNLPSEIKNPSEVRLIIKREKWKRIKGEKLEELKELDFGKLVRADDIRFVPARLGDFPQVKFVAVNDSPLNFWQVEAQITIRQSGKIRGFYVTGIDNLITGSRRPIVINWYDKLPLFSSPEVIMSVNYLDPNNIKPYSEEDFGL